jgi:branched-chain amino acid aminotransferase
MNGGTHAFHQDERNRDIKVYVNREIVHRDQAKVSVFDSGFLLGDGIWESFRLHNGKLAFLAQHVYRLRESAKALDMDLGMTDQEIVDAIYDTTRANDMETNVHIRLVFSRGMKSTPFQDPRVNIGGCTLVIIPEYKLVDESTEGISLYTVYNRRGRPDVQDPKLHPLSKLNCVLACIQVAKAGADEALMLDPHGFVAACNSTSFFIVRQGQVWTSTGNYCLHGITREVTIELCSENGIEVLEKDFSLLEAYAAEESFVTGTFGGLRHVTEIDGRIIGNGQLGPVTEKLQRLYQERLDKECE